MLRRYRRSQTRKLHQITPIYTKIHQTFHNQKSNSFFFLRLADADVSYHLLRALSTTSTKTRPPAKVWPCETPKLSFSFLRLSLALGEATTTTSLTLWRELAVGSRQPQQHHHRPVASRGNKARRRGLFNLTTACDQATVLGLLCVEAGHQGRL